MCTGSCTVGGGIMCNGTCNGNCKYTPGSATCQGECHGSCSAQVSPPTCTGSVDCTASAQCHASCQASATASIDCSKPEVTIAISGNDDAILLSAAVHNHLAEWGEAVSLLAALKTPIQSFGSTGIDAFSALGDVGLTGGVCLAQSVSVAAQASVSINVSVTASASFTAGS
jgi:hypothetical protein